MYHNWNTVISKNPKPEFIIVLFDSAPSKILLSCIKAKSFYFCISIGTRLQMNSICVMLYFTPLRTFHTDKNRLAHRQRLRHINDISPDSSLQTVSCLNCQSHRSANSTVTEMDNVIAETSVCRCYIHVVPILNFHLRPTSTSVFSK